MAWLDEQWDQPLTPEVIRSASDDELDDWLTVRLLRRIDLSQRVTVEALPPIIQAILVTRTFEWTVMNGGLYQFFLNFADRPWFLTLVLHGYSTLHMTEQRRLLEEQIIPTALSVPEKQLRDRELREPFTDAAGESALSSLDELIVDHTDERLRVVRQNANLFAG